MIRLRGHPIRLPRPRPKLPLPHQPSHPIVPDPTAPTAQLLRHPRAAVAVLHLLLDPLDQVPELLVRFPPRALPAPQPGIESAPRHAQVHGHLLHAVLPPMIRHEAVLHLGGLREHGHYFSKYFPILSQRGDFLAKPHQLLVPWGAVAGESSLSRGGELLAPFVDLAAADPQILLDLFPASAPRPPASSRPQA